MPNVKIKQLDTRVSCSGIHMGGGRERRKLYPNEIIALPEDFEAGEHGGESLFAALWKTGKLEITPEAATRPIDFANEREAMLTSPYYRSRGPSEDAEISKAFENVEARLNMVDDENDTPAKPRTASRVKSPQRVGGNPRNARRATQR